MPLPSTTSASSSPSSFQMIVDAKSPSSMCLIVQLWIEFAKCNSKSLLLRGVTPLTIKALLRYQQNIRWTRSPVMPTCGLISLGTLKYRLLEIILPLVETILWYVSSSSNDLHSPQNGPADHALLSSY